MSLARGLPAGCAVRRATAADARYVARLLRAVDRAEMEALEGRPALEVLQGWMDAAPRVLTIRGDAVAIWGLAACSDALGSAMPWLATVSTLGHDDLMTLMWLSRVQVDAWQRRWPVLQCVCDTRNSFHAQWLDWLGFARQGRVERFGATGLPFDLYRRLRSAVLH